MSLLQIRPRTPPPNGVARLPKAVANSNDRMSGDYVAGAMEGALPLTPERLELIKACAGSRSPHADAVAASRIAQRFAPRPPAAPVWRRAARRRTGATDGSVFRLGRGD